jgi:hypothetical protein
MAGAGGKSGNRPVIDLGGLSVVSARVVILVYMNLLAGLYTIFHLEYLHTVHSHSLASSGILGRSLDGHLSVFYKQG